MLFLYIVFHSFCFVWYETNFQEEQNAIFFPRSTQNNLWLYCWTPNKKIPRFLCRCFFFSVSTFLFTLHVHGLSMVFVFCSLPLCSASLHFHIGLSFGGVAHRNMNTWTASEKKNAKHMTGTMEWARKREALNTFKDLQSTSWTTNKHASSVHWTRINLTYWKGTFVSKSD